MDLLVSFPWHRFYPAWREVRRVLKQLGDSHPHMEWTPVEGIAIVHTALEPRKVVAGCRELFCRGKESFNYAVRWAPVDRWCATNLDVIKRLLEEEIAGQIGEDETWALQVDRHRWREYHTDEIVASLAPAIKRKVDLTKPDKIVRIDIIDQRTAIALLRPEEIFSVLKTVCAAESTSSTGPEGEPVH